MGVLKLETDNTKAMQLPDLLHCYRVANLVFTLCIKLGIENKVREEMFIAATLHDVGKSMISKDILNKPGKLNSTEWNAIKHHAELGGVIASNMNQNLSIVKSIVHHHENYDGTGYPRQLQGEEIPLGASIIRVCDTYDALRMKRPYKKAFSHEEALNEMKNEKEKYHPKVFNSFISMNFEEVKGVKVGSMNGF